MRQHGFSYLMLIFIVAIMGVLLAATATVWHTVVTRNKERELLIAGDAYRTAIGLYYENTPGPAKHYPKTLTDLLEDRRQPVLTRYLRKLYIDPLSASRDWGLVPGPDGTIMGVYSQSKAQPVKTGNFDEDDTGFEGKHSYQDWQFSYSPTQAAPAPTAAAQTRPPTTPQPLPGTAK